MLSNGFEPGLGEIAVINSLPLEVQGFLSEAIKEEPWFLEEYVIPTLQGLDGAEKIVSDLSWALAEIEVEEELFGLDPSEYDYVPGLGFLGKSLKKKLKKVVKKVVEPVKKVAEKVQEVHKKIEEKIVPKKLLEVKEKIKDTAKSVHEKAKDKIHEAAKRAGGAIQRAGTGAGKFIHRAAKSGKLQIALAPFTAGVSLAFHPKVKDAAKKFMAGPYGNIVVGALGALFAIPTGGASVAAAAALTTANTMYLKKKAAEEARKAARADAGQLEAEAAQLQSEAERLLNDFYNQNEAFLTGQGLTRAIWNAASFDEKVALLDAAASGQLQASAPPTAPSPTGPIPVPPQAEPARPPQQPFQSPASSAPIQPGDFTATMPAPGGGGGGGGGGGTFPDPVYRPPGAQPQQAAATGGMSGLLLPALAAVGLLAFASKGKKGRARRNPSRRRIRRSA